MSTRREEIAAIRSMDRLLSGETQINDRSIDRELRDTALLLITRETNKRKLFSSPNIFTPIPCLPMKEVSLSECCEYTSPMSISRSVSKIPKIAEGNYGLLIQSASDPDKMVYFKECSPRRFSNILKLGLPNRDLFYWFYNEYLYVSNADTKGCTLSAYFEEDVPTTLLYPGEDCQCKNHPKPEDIFKNPLDQPFRCPGYLLGAVRGIVLKNLMDNYYKLVQQKTQNDTDQQTKTV